MKKVLLASTALAMTAGVASAQGVELSGYAEIGIKDNGDEIVFHNDFDVKFTLSGETDNGLTFGATIDLDEVSDGIDADENKSSVFVSGNFGTITMGDTDGAFDWAMSEVGFGTSLADDHTTHAGFNFNSGLDGSLDGQVVRYEYSFGDFAVALSAEIGANTSATDENLGIGLTYDTSFGGTEIGIGLAYQDGTLAVPVPAGAVAALGLGPNPGIGATGDILGLSLTADFAGGFSTKLNFSTVDGTITSTSSTTYSFSTSSTTGGINTNVNTTAQNIGVEWDHYGIGVAYAMDNFIIEANYGQFDGTIAGVGDFDADGYGVAVNYDLGGGAVAMFGYGSGTDFALDGTAGTDKDTWSAVLGLSF